MLCGRTPANHLKDTYLCASITVPSHSPRNYRSWLSGRESHFTRQLLFVIVYTMIGTTHGFLWPKVALPPPYGCRAGKALRGRWCMARCKENVSYRLRPTNSFTARCKAARKDCAPEPGQFPPNRPQGINRRSTAQIAVATCAED